MSTPSRNSTRTKGVGRKRAPLGRYNPNDTRAKAHGPWSPSPIQSPSPIHSPFPIQSRTRSSFRRKMGRRPCYRLPRAWRASTPRRTAAGLPTSSASPAPISTRTRLDQDLGARAYQRDATPLWFRWSSGATYKASSSSSACKSRSFSGRVTDRYRTSRTLAVRLSLFSLFWDAWNRSVVAISLCLLGRIALWASRTWNLHRQNQILRRDSPGLECVTDPLSPLVKAEWRKCTLPLVAGPTVSTN